MNTRQAQGSAQSYLHRFITRLLGSDNSERDVQPALSQGFPVPLWVSAFRSMKLSDIFQGITLSANVWWLLLFLAFISWLFVIYWIRHHELTINKVLGNKLGHSLTTSYDRRIVDAVQGALPTQISFETPAGYSSINGNGGVSPPALLPGQAYAGTQAHQSGQSAPQYSPLAPFSTTNPQDTSNSRTSMMPPSNTANMSTSSTFCHSANFSSPVASFRAAYCVPEQSLTGMRFKTVVNR